MNFDFWVTRKGGRESPDPPPLPPDKIALPDTQRADSKIGTVAGLNAECRVLRVYRVANFKDALRVMRAPEQTIAPHCHSATIATAGGLNPPTPTPLRQPHN